MKRIRERFTTTVDHQILAAAKKKSEDTSIPLSAVVDRFLAFWVGGGSLPPKAIVDAVPAEGEKPAKRKRS